jgi:hypothetical protein
MLRGLEQVTPHDRLVGGGVVVFAVGRLAEVRPVTDDRFDRPVRPLTPAPWRDALRIHPARERGPRLPGRPALEQHPDHPSLTFDDLERLSLRGLHVSERGVSVDATSDGPAGGGLPPFGDAPALHPAEGEQDGHAELTEGRGRVDAEVERGELSPMLRDLRDEGQRVGDPGTGQAVDVGDRDPFRFAVADAGHEGVQAGPRERAAGLVEVGVPFGDLDAPRRRPCGDTLPLIVRGDERLAGTPADLRDADVAVESHDRRVYALTGILRSKNDERAYR